jgi:hypothetical protein
LIKLGSLPYVAAADKLRIAYSVAGRKEIELAVDEAAIPLSLS